MSVLREPDLFRPNGIPALMAKAKAYAFQVNVRATLSMISTKYYQSLKKNNNEYVGETLAVKN
jgi:hypothetical protein